MIEVHRVADIAKQLTNKLFSGSIHPDGVLFIIQEVHRNSTHENKRGRR